jgi:site-specific DNA recombinase
MSEQGSAEIDVYARVSRASDDRQRSVKGQVDDCAGRLSERGLRPGKVHIDNSRSAWNPRVHRPGWDALMARLESGATGGVIVFDLARFSRRPIEGERLIAAAENGMLVLDSENEYDLTSANGKKAFRDQLSGAAYESDRLSTRVKRGKRAKAQRGEPNVSSRPFGFEADGVTIREEEAALLRDWTARFLDGESQDALIAEANERGILTSYGKAWTRAGLRQLLTRHRNAGLVVHRGAVVGRLPGEPIISEDESERVHAVYAARRNGRPPSTLYLCSGIALCGLCDHRLTGRPRANMKPYEDGQVRRQYWCSPSTGGCGRIAVDQRGLDEHAAALTLAVLSDRRHAGAIEHAARRIAEQADKLDESIAEIEHLAAELAGRLGRLEITLDRYDAATKPLDRRLAELQAQRDALPDADAPVIDTAASRQEWERRWKAADTTERRALLRMALRGRELFVDPAVPTDRTNVSARVRIGKQHG